MATFTGIIADSELLAPLVDHATSAEIKLSNGIDIETRAASWRRLRGVTCIACICGRELLLVLRRKFREQRQRNLPSCRPALATTHGLMAVISTPYARRGATWESFHRDYGAKGDPEILVAAGASRTFNPRLASASLTARMTATQRQRQPSMAASGVATLVRSSAVRRSRPAWTVA